MSLLFLLLCLPCGLAATNFCSSLEEAYYCMPGSVCDKSLEFDRTRMGRIDVSFDFSSQFSMTWAAAGKAVTITPFVRVDGTRDNFEPYHPIDGVCRRDNETRFNEQMAYWQREFGDPSNVHEQHGDAPLEMVNALVAAGFLNAQTGMGSLLMQGITDPSFRMNYVVADDTDTFYMPCTMTCCSSDPTTCPHLLRTGGSPYFRNILEYRGGGEQHTEICFNTEFSGDTEGMVLSGNTLVVEGIAEITAPPKFLQTKNDFETNAAAIERDLVIGFENGILSLCATELDPGYPNVVIDPMFVPLSAPPPPLSPPPAPPPPPSSSIPWLFIALATLGALGILAFVLSRYVCSVSVESA